MPKARMLVQMDTSIHRWIPSIDEPWCLIAAIDDATNEVPYALFTRRDTVLANMRGSGVLEDGRVLVLYKGKVMAQATLDRGTEENRRREVEATILFRTACVDL